MMRAALRRFNADAARRPPVWLVPRAASSAAAAAGADAGGRGPAVDAKAPCKLVKRKVAIVGAYLGTGFHGVQLNKDVGTIEDELRKVILQAGAMRESNFEDLAKIDWSRSSRTDKGVHAGCIVFSGKLLIDEEKEMDRHTGRLKSLADKLNAALPPTIRVFSCTRVNKRFAARKNCVLREYEYFLPLSFLQTSVLAPPGETAPPPLAIDTAVDRFKAALREYEGIHDFHNFTKSRSFFYKEFAKMQQLKQSARLGNRDGGDQEEDEDSVEDNAEKEGEDDDIDGHDDSQGDEYRANASQLGDKDETVRKLLPRHRRAIYSCSGSVIQDFLGEPFLRVHIVGQAFLFNQIRCMVGGALAVATNGMTHTAFRAALDTNRIVRVPIAPPDGLVLLSSTFGGKLHTVSLYKDPNTVLARERKDISHRILLNRSEDAEMRKFREQVIYKEIVESWKAEDKTERWRAYLERVYENNERLDDVELGKILGELDTQKQEIAQKRLNFVHRNRVDLAEGGVQGALLPKQFTTKLCVRFSVAPGIFTSDIRRGVSKHIKRGLIPNNASDEEILSYIEDYGVGELAEEGRRLRLSIRS